MSTVTSPSVIMYSRAQKCFFTFAKLKRIEIFLPESYPSIYLDPIDLLGDFGDLSKLWVEGLAIKVIRFIIAYFL